jgi:hypothetical protein
MRQVGPVKDKRVFVATPWTVSHFQLRAALRQDAAVASAGARASGAVDLGAAGEEESTEDNRRSLPPRRRMARIDCRDRF